MPRPNLVFILADDLGWRDLGCYGSSFYETPNLDRLAQEGTRFTDAYAASPACSPTRASIQSGQYPARVGVTDWIDFTGNLHPTRGKLIDAQYVDHLPTDVTSLAEALSDAGYQTWHVGKWHLGGEPHHPENHGYNENVAGCSWGLPTNGYFSPWDMPNLDDGPPGEYLTDRLGAEAVRLIEGNAADEAPFFLNLNFYSVHTPIQGKDQHVEKYEQKRTALGLDDATEFEKGLRFPIEHLKDRWIKRRQIQSDPEYASMVQSLDENVGRILDTLETLEIAEKTLVVVTSDNGGLSTAETPPTSNRPLNEGKGWMYEGGTRVPFLMRWPEVVPADDVSNVPLTSPDIYSTLLDAANISLPETQTVDGESVLPLFNGGSLDREAIFWHYPHYGNLGGTPSAAIRVDNWKLIEFYEDNHVELYNLNEDLGERVDQSEQEPERTVGMHERLKKWRKEVEARYPQENPEYEPWPDRSPAGHITDSSE